MKKFYKVLAVLIIALSFKAKAEHALLKQFFNVNIQYTHYTSASDTFSVSGRKLKTVQDLKDLIKKHTTHSISPTFKIYWKNLHGGVEELHEDYQVVTALESIWQAYMEKPSGDLKLNVIVK